MNICGPFFLLVVTLYLRADASELDERVKEICKGKATGSLLPHPANCHWFIQCAYGVSYVKKCRKDLFFNPSINVCDWSKNVNCKGNACNKNNGGCEQKCVYIDHSRYRCSCRSGYELNYNKTSCIPGPINMETYCEGKHGQQLPDPRRCNAFIKCEGKKSKPFICGGGLIYNEALKICDWPGNGKCKAENFGPWTQWSACFKAMWKGDCIQKRTRKCTSGGILCEEWKSEIRSCKKEECTKKKCGLAPLQDDSIAVFIIDGRQVVKGSIPWQVAIYIDEDEFHCGGSLIDKRHVISAAHCFPSKGSREMVGDYQIVLGEHDRSKEEGTEQKLSVTKITTHEGYIIASTTNDIAILTLSEDAKISDFIAPICFPKENEELKPGTSCKVSGWGNTYHDPDGNAEADVLQEITVPVVAEDVCKKRNNNGMSMRKVTNDMICTGFNDGTSFNGTCHGDSGGPLACTLNGVWKLYGVVSWGDSQCNALNKFNVFTKVSKYIGWINDNKS